MNTEAKSPKAPEISIAGSAVLVEMYISVWSGRKQDKEAGEEVVKNKNAQRGAAAVTKSLLGDCRELEELKKFSSEIRNWHYKKTLPWSDSGLRLLPMGVYFDYMTEIGKMQRTFESLVDDFVAVYPVKMLEARQKLGDLFCSTDYPDAAYVRDKFAFNVNFIPVPEAGDFRMDVGREANKQLKESYEKYYQERLNDAMADVWRRLYDHLAKMSERLDDSGGNKVFRDSLVGNLLEVADMLKVCNVTNDPAMEESRQNLIRALTGVTPEGLRKDGGLRRKTKAEVDAILQSLPTLN